MRSESELRLPVLYILTIEPSENNMANLKILLMKCLDF